MKNKLVRTGLSIAVMGLCLTSAKAQDAATTPSEPPTVREVGIGINGFTASSFALRYQCGTDKDFFRLNTAILSGSSTAGNFNSTNSDTLSSSSTSTNNTPINIGLNVNMCWGHVKPINDKLGFECGPEIGVVVSYVQTNNATTNTSQGNTYTSNNSSSTGNVKPFVGLLLGVRYQLSPAFYLYADVTPNVYYSYTNTAGSSVNSVTSYTTTSNNTTSSVGLSGLSNSGAMITLTYRF